MTAIMEELFTEMKGEKWNPATLDVQKWLSPDYWTDEAQDTWEGACLMLG